MLETLIPKPLKQQETSQEAFSTRIPYTKSREERWPLLKVTLLRKALTITTCYAKHLLNRRYAAQGWLLSQVCKLSQAWLHQAWMWQENFVILIKWNGHINLIKPILWISICQKQSQQTLTLGTRTCRRESSALEALKYIWLSLGWTCNCPVQKYGKRMTGVLEEGNGDSDCYTTLLDSCWNTHLNSYYQCKLRVQKLRILGKETESLKDEKVHCNITVDKLLWTLRKKCTCILDVSTSRAL